jgi:hypothetical protein
MIEKYGFVYIWFDRKRKMYYIGCHWGTVDDGYICSSNRMRDAYRRRPQDFKRRLLRTNIKDKTKVLEEEYRWLSKIKIEELGERYYNLSSRHFGHWLMTNDYKSNKHPFFGKKHSEETKQKMRGRKVSEETREKLKESAIKQFSNPENRKKAGEANIGRTSYMAGKTHTDEARKKMSESLIGNVPWNKGKSGLQTHSEETRQKMRGPRGPQKNPRKKKVIVQ